MCSSICGGDGGDGSGGPYVLLSSVGVPNGVMPLNMDGDAVGTMVQRVGTATQLQDVVLRRGEFATDGDAVRVGDDNTVWANLPWLGQVQLFSYTGVHNTGVNVAIQSSNADLVIHSWTRNDDRWPPSSYDLETVLVPNLGQRIMLMFSYRYIQDTGGTLLHVNNGANGKGVFQGIDPTIGIWSWNKPSTSNNPAKARTNIAAGECAIIELLGIPGWLKKPSHATQDNYIWQVTSLVNVQIGEAVI
jgi:hypothetical protein